MGVGVDVTHMLRQIEFSNTTFGPGIRTEGVVDHIRDELQEILDDPTDLTEWVDVIILALDGAWRCYVDSHPESSHMSVAFAVLNEIKAKQEINEGRAWPDWRTQDPRKAIGHVR